MTRDSRWILLEPLDAIDVTSWRRYKLAGKFGVTAYTSLRAISADGQRLVIERSDCAVDCPQGLHQYYELGFPTAAQADQPQPPATVVSYEDTAPGHRAQLSRKPCALAANLATNPAYTVTSALHVWSATVQATNAAVVPYDQARAYELLDVESLKVLHARTELYSIEEGPRR